MAFKTYKFRSQVEMDLFLNGGILCGNDKAAMGVEGLVGLTLTFTSPAGAVTFAEVAGRDNPAVLTISDIREQIAAVPALANLMVLNLGGAVAFMHATPGTVVSLPAPFEAARVLLGLAKTGVITGTVRNPPAATYTVPYVFWVHQSGGFWGVTVVE